jgi:hypothetical protein
MIAQSDRSQLVSSYTAYLVRMWQDNEQTPWRASAQCVRTGEKVYFASPESLCAFLLAQIAASPSGEQKLPGAYNGENHHDQHSICR